jgi:proteic killer suppression protein
MIKSFKSKETEKVFSRQRSEQLPDEIQRLALRELRMLDQALAVQDNWLPTRNGSDIVNRYRVAIDDRWQISFRWHNGQADEVEIVDTHLG